MKYKAIAFDFDGVLVESTDIKDQAFYELYLPHGKEVATKVLEHHCANRGVSRYEKIRHAHENYLQRKITEEELTNLAAKFSRLVEKKVVDAPEVAGAEEFLRKYHKELRLFVLSATPEKELVNIMKGRGIADYFTRIYGFPTSKAEGLQEILKTYGYRATEVVMIGDASADLEAANSVGIPFIARIAPKSSELSGHAPAIENLHELSQWLG